MPSPSKIADRYGSWAVVTGASEGIGRAFAVELASAGVNLVLVARRRDRLEELATEFRERTQTATRVVDLDLSKADAIDSLANRTSGLDVGLLVAAAGFGTSGPFIGGSRDTELNMIDLNCRVVAGLSHVFGGRFVERGSGGIILMSSLLAFQGVAGAANYAATKAYVQTLAEGLRTELTPHGIDVLASAPGPIRSGFEARADMRMSMAQTPDVVAKATLAALGHRTTIRPGWLAKTLEGAMTGLPRWGRSRILSMVMRDMTKHHERPAPQAS